MAIILRLCGMTFFKVHIRRLSLLVKQCATYIKYVHGELMSLYPPNTVNLMAQRNQATPLFMLNMQSGNVACYVSLYMK